MDNNGSFEKVDKISLPVISRRNDFSDTFHSETCFFQPHLDTDDGKNKRGRSLNK